jgi:hypothetical protein
MRPFWPVLLLSLMSAHLFSAEPPKIRTLAKGGFSGFQEPAEIVVTNATQWAEVWKKHSAQQKPAKPAPEVNFEKETVLLVSLGQKRSGGYSVEITGLEESDGKTKVIAKTKAPKPGGIQLQAITSPFHIVAVPRIKGPVAFKLD